MHLSDMPTFAKLPHFFQVIVFHADDHIKIFVPYLYTLYILDSHVVIHTSVPADSAGVVEYE